jgi:hypothetical protein
MPLLRLVAVAKTALLARRHLRKLNSRDRRRLGELAKRGPRLNRSERGELVRLLGKLEPRALAFATADAFSPLPLPKRLTGRAGRR